MVPRHFLTQQRRVVVIVEREVKKMEILPLLMSTMISFRRCERRFMHSCIYCVQNCWLLQSLNYSLHGKLR